MPGEERKFKRRRMMAFLPFCKREREETKSQAEATGVPVMGVDVKDGAGVAGRVGRGPAVDSEAFVLVGDGRGV
jgi:hypothetical protein